MFNIHPWLGGTCVSCITLILYNHNYYSVVKREIFHYYNNVGAVPLICHCSRSSNYIKLLSTITTSSITWKGGAVPSYDPGHDVVAVPVGARDQDQVEAGIVGNIFGNHVGVWTTTRSLVAVPGSRRYLLLWNLLDKWL